MHVVCSRCFAFSMRGVSRPSWAPNGDDLQVQMTDISQLKGLQILQNIFKLCWYDLQHLKKTSVNIFRILGLQMLRECPQYAFMDPPLVLPVERSLISMGQAQRQLLPKHPVDDHRPEHQLAGMSLRNPKGVVYEDMAPAWHRSYMELKCQSEAIGQVRYHQQALPRHNFNRSGWQHCQDNFCFLRSVYTQSSPNCSATQRLAWCVWSMRFGFEITLLPKANAEAERPSKPRSLEDGRKRTSSACSIHFGDGKIPESLKFCCFVASSVRSFSPMRAPGSASEQSQFTFSPPTIPQPHLWSCSAAPQKFQKLKTSAPHFER